MPVEPIPCAFQLRIIHKTFREIYPLLALDLGLSLHIAIQIWQIGVIQVREPRLVIDLCEGLKGNINAQCRPKIIEEGCDRKQARSILSFRLVKSHTVAYSN